MSPGERSDSGHGAAGGRAVASGASPTLASEGGAYLWIADQVDRAEQTERAGPTDGGDGQRPGLPLAGYTFAVKDILAVEGVPTTLGSEALATAEPEPADAEVVARLRAGGAVLTGVTTLHELAFGVTGVNRYTGTPRNPALPGCIPGGSSSGSAVAVAEGSARVALGTDTGGSVRIPAAACGVVGFKPCYSSYPRSGLVPMSPTLDHIGVLARSVSDVRAVHGQLRGSWPAHVDPSTEARPGSRAPIRTETPAPTKRIGMAPEEIAAADAVVGGTIERALSVLSGAGFDIVAVALPSWDEIFDVSTTIMFSEAARQHRSLLEARSDRLGPDVASRLEAGAALSDARYQKALGDRIRMAEALHTLLDSFDGLIGPTLSALPPRLEAVGSPEVSLALVRHTRLADLTRQAAISVPVLGPSGEAGIGVQVTSTTDEACLRLAAVLEGLTDHSSDAQPSRHHKENHA